CGRRGLDVGPGLAGADGVMLQGAADAAERRADAAGLDPLVERGPAALGELRVRGLATGPERRALRGSRPHAAPEGADAELLQGRAGQRAQGALDGDPGGVVLVTYAAPLLVGLARRLNRGRGAARGSGPEKRRAGDGAGSARADRQQHLGPGE